MKTSEGNSKEHLITALEVSRTNSVSKRTVTNWVKARIIPAIRIGRVLRFDPAKVKAALEKFEQKEITR